MIRRSFTLYVLMFWSIYSLAAQSMPGTVPAGLSTGSHPAVITSSDQNVTVNPETRPDPIISLDPIGWDFGIVQINTQLSRTFTISNPGTDTLLVSAISLSDSSNEHFSLTLPVGFPDQPISLLTGQSAIFTVIYAPLVVGTHNAVISITHNTGADLVAELFGTGYDINVYIPPDYLTDFELWPPVDWNLSGGTYQFTQYTAADGNNWAKASFLSQVSGTSVMSTPPLHVAGGNAQLRFTWSHLYHYLYPGDALSIRVSNNSTTWYQFWQKTGSALDSNDSDIMSAPGSGITETIDIPSAYTDSTFWIRFVATSGYGRNLYIDNAIVRQTPTTPVLIHFPDALDFSIREQNVTAGPMHLTVINDGIDTLFIAANDLSILGTDAGQFSFSDVNLPAALLFGEAVTIPVYMTSTTNGVKNATLRIANDQGRTDYDIPLGGEGADGVVNMANGFTNLQSGEVFGFYDSGGPSGSYTSDEDYTYTFFPPAGELIKAEFPVFSLESGYDFLDVFQGSSTDGLLLQTLTGESAPEQIISAEGALTFRFSSDDSYQEAGWIIRISSVSPLPLPPDIVILLNPANEATWLPIDGFELTWTPGVAGGLPTSYDVLLSDNPEDMGQYVFSTTETFLNPTQTANPFAFTYNLVYYWTVQAFNEYGFSEPAEIRSFRIEPSPAQIIVTPGSFSETLTHPDSLSSSLGLTVSNQGGRPLSFRIGMSATTVIYPEPLTRQNHPVPADPNAVQNAERSPYPGSAMETSERAIFDLQFNLPTFLNDGEYGIATDGEYFYTTDWSSVAGGLDVAKYNLDGSFVEEFRIIGVGSVRDLTYDGQYFYGSAVSTTVYVMDFTAAALISTFTAPVSVRGIAYDSEADAFWIGNNWSANLRLINRNGVQLRSLNTAVGNFAGLAYDNLTGLVPTLWGLTQGIDNSSIWVQIDLATGAVLQSYNMVQTGINLGGSPAGGCEIVSGLVPGTATLLGNIQNVSFFGLELCPYFSWVTPALTSGTLQSGETVLIDLNFNASDLDIDTYSSFLKIYNDTATGQVDLPVTLTVAGVFPAVFSVEPDLAFDFGNIEQLNPAIRTFTITNTGGSVPEAIGFGPDDIYLTDDADSCFAVAASGLPVTLRHNESYQFDVIFTPQSLGLKTAMLNIEDNLGRMLHTIDLAGTGITETIGTVLNLTATLVTRDKVRLNWNLAIRDEEAYSETGLSRSAGFAKSFATESLPVSGDDNERALLGYNVYRNNTGPINPALLTVKTYLDEGLTTGTYKYAVQGVYYTGVTAMSDSVTIYVNTDPPPLPFTENWSSGTFTANGWTAVSTNWYIRTNYGNPSPCAAFSYSPHVLNYDLPLTSLPFRGTDLPAIKLKFDLSLSNYSTATAESLSWEVWDGEAWTIIGSASNASGSFPWTTYAADITDYAAGHDFRIRFRAHGADNDNINYWNLDNIILKLMLYGLDAPVVDIDLLTGMLTLSWETVENAEMYKVYATDDLYVPDPWTLIATTADLSVTISGDDVRKFLRVVAIAGD